MKVFFQIKFSITAKEETQIEEELSNYVLTWLESKYGVAAKRAISACKSLLSDSEFGDPNGLFVETVHYEDVKYAQHNLWACKVMEPPKRWGKFVPRRWATEVGYEQTSDKSADISYSVRYDDIASNGEKRAPRPQFNLPKLAEMLISSEKWICTANGEVLHATNYQQHVGPVFGIDECRAAKEQALNAGEDKMDKHWISLCKVNRPDKNRDIWMLRLADAVGGVLVAPYFDKQKEQIHDNRLFVFCDDGPTEPGRIGFWEWEEFESEPGRWKTTSTYMEQASPVEVTDEAKWNAIDALEDAGIDVSEEEFMELFNAWILSTCDNAVILGHTIKDTTREKVRPNYVGYGVTKDSKFSTSIRKIMGWGDNDPISAKWNRILRETFMDEGSESNGKYYIDLSRVKPRFDLSHTWFRCEHCSELTPYMLKGKCPNCQHESIHPMTDAEISALDFWRKPINDALQGEPIRAIDTEEHTAQLSHKDQRDELWSKTEQYELRFQDFLQNGEAPVDILSSTTTMEVGIDIGSLVAVGLRNIPPMRENYQQRAGRAGRRGSSLSTIVTFCEDGPHDSLYFSNPVPMFRGDPRKPWIDVRSEKIVQRHLGMVALQAYLQLKGNSLDVIPAIDFLDENLQDFCGFLDTFAIDCMSILVPINSQKALRSYKSSLKDSLSVLKLKRDAHPELFESDGSGDSSKKTFLDALYEEGIIPTYSFPKNVVSTYISGIDGKVKYQVERGLDVAIGEYAPGRAIVVDKTTYQIGGLYYPGGGRTEQTAYSPARAFIQDASYCKNISTCTECGWFGLDEDHPHKCPFCGNDKLTHMLPMLRPWGFAPRDAKAIEQAQLSEEYTATQQPLYSTLPDADDVVAIKGYSNTRMAVRPNQRIIMLNKGIGDKGFTICCDCGAAMPGDDPSVLKDIMRPYRSKFLRTRCKHNETKNVNLGYDFITDMLVLEIALDRQQVSMDLAKNSWLNRAGQSLAEALRLSACQELDIEFTELVTGFRVRQNQKGDFIDIYLYDSLSSGAGYAVSIEASIQQLLIKTRELLSSCNCDSACHKCLKHYRNQYVHGLLDRSAALDLLTWAEKGVRSPMLPVYEQRNSLQSVEQILQFSGVHIDFDHEPIEAESFHGKKRIVVYPAMWARPTEKNMVFVSDSYLKYAKPYALKTIVGGL